MTDTALFAVALALLAWWISTGVILIVVRRADHAGGEAHRMAVLGAVPVLALGLVLVLWSAGRDGVEGAYAGFLGALAVWGWLELTFLTGMITGPDLRPCPPGLAGRARFERALGAILHHEIALLLGLLLCLAATTHGVNQTAGWTFAVLFGARISAKLNLFLGVPRINTEFIPGPLAHLAGHFRKGPTTYFFVASVTFLSLTVGCFIQQYRIAETSGDAVSSALLAALATLALAEHWLMLVPLPDARLWRWMLPADPRPNAADDH